MSCDKTNFSIIFNKNVSLDLGLKLLRMEGSKFGLAGSYGEGFVIPGPVLGTECWRHKFGIGGVEARSVMVELVSKVRWGLVREGFMSE